MKGYANITNSNRSRVSYVDLPKGQLCVDNLLVELLQQDAWQQRADGPEVQPNDSCCVTCQQLQLFQQGRLPPDLKNTGIVGELEGLHRLAVQEFAEALVAASRQDPSVVLDNPRRQVLVIDAVEVRHLLAHQHVGLGSVVGGPVQRQHLVDGVANGQRLDVVAAEILDKRLNTLAVADANLGKHFGGVVVQPGIALNAHGHLGLDQLDQDKAEVGAERGLREAQILGRGGIAPAAGEHPVGLAHPLGLEVVEVVLHQLVQIVAEEDLELVLELVGLWQCLLSYGGGLENVRRWLPYDPGPGIIARDNAHRQRKEPVPK